MASDKDLLVKSAAVNDAHIRFDLSFKHRLTMVLGESATGKSCLYKALANYDVINGNVPLYCVNILDRNNIDLETFFFSKSDTLFVIDNADIILSAALGFRISVDKRNQYLIFCHSYGGLKPAANSLTRLNIENGVGKLHYIF